MLTHTPTQPPPAHLRVPPTLTPTRSQPLSDRFEQLEAQLDEVRAGLVRSHRLATLGTIACVIAHEYNNILTPVISYAQLALASPDDPALMRKALVKALAGAQRAANISTSMLGFARERHMDDSASLPEVVEQTLSCLGRDPARDGIELTLDLPPVRLAISSLHLQQVLLNLILNARKVMRPNGGALRLTGQVRGHALRLEVADTGPGIPAAIMDRLFEPFVTYSTSASSHGDAGTLPSRCDGEEEGTGLGLCICRDLLHQAGGAIVAVNRRGGGASFILTIPLAQ